MITIIVLPESRKRLLSCLAQLLAQSINIRRHLVHHFFLGDTTNSSILFIHAHIRDIVKFAENTHLRELGDARQENKAEIRLAHFQWTIEIAHNVAKNLQGSFFVYYIQQRGIILIDEHDYLLACLLISSLNQIGQTIICSILRCCNTIRSLFHSQLIAQIFFQLLLFHMLATRHIKMQHRIFRPLLLQLFDGKSFKQILLTLKITFEC